MGNCTVLSGSNIAIRIRWIQPVFLAIEVFNYRCPGSLSSVVLIAVFAPSFPPPPSPHPEGMARIHREATPTGSASDASEGGSRGLAADSSSRVRFPSLPRPSLAPLSLSILLSWFCHCRERELKVAGRTDDREFPRGIVTKLLTASRPTRARRWRWRRLFASFALLPPPPLRGLPRPPHPVPLPPQPSDKVRCACQLSEEQNQLWNARFYTSRRR